MKQKIGKICMVLGALLILASAALLAYNQWDASRADKAAQQALDGLEQTLNETVEEKAKDDSVILQPDDRDGTGRLELHRLPVHPFHRA